MDKCCSEPFSQAHVRPASSQSPGPPVLGWCRPLWAGPSAVSDSPPLPCPQAHLIQEVCLLRLYCQVTSAVLSWQLMLMRTYPLIVWWSVPSRTHQKARQSITQVRSDLQWGWRRGTPETYRHLAPGSLPGMHDCFYRLFPSSFRSSMWTIYLTVRRIETRRSLNIDPRNLAKDSTVWECNSKSAELFSYGHEVRRIRLPIGCYNKISHAGMTQTLEIG